MKISIYRLPRSGSSMVRRCLWLVARSVPNSHAPFTVTEGPLVITLRDFRDCLYSHWRIHCEHKNEIPTRGQIHCAMNRLDRRIDKLEQMSRVHQDYPQRWFWRYEDTYAAPYAAVSKLEQICGRMLIPEEIERVRQIVSPEATKLLQDSMLEPEPGKKPFDVKDKTVGLHKNHVGKHKGRPGEWRKGIPQELHREINTHYQKALERWGYEV